MRTQPRSQQPPDASVALVPGPWEHHMVTANGARFHVAVAGEGPLVLLLHGFPEFWWTWRHQIPALEAAGYRVAAMDLRGFGASDKPPRGYDPRTLAEDVSGVIRSLGERDAVVVGHGLGGLVAWTLSVVHPRQVRRLVAVSMPHPRRLRRAYLTDVRQARATRHLLAYQTPLAPERRLVADDADLVSTLLHEWSATTDGSWPPADIDARYREAARIPGVAHSALEFFRWGFRSIPRPDGLRYARRMSSPVTVPTLQIHGSRDPYLLTSTALGSERYVEAPYRWHLMAGVGHFPHEQEPDAFTDVLLSWLADSSPEDA